MTERKTPRIKQEGFIGFYLSPDLLEKLDAKVAQTTLNRSQVIRLALIGYLEKESS